MVRSTSPKPRLAICIRNDGYPASLEKGKVYRILADPAAAKHGCVRVVDESEEDYLYPADWFVPIKLPASAQKTVVDSLTHVAS